MININQSNLKNIQASVLSAHVDIHNKQKDIKDSILDTSQFLRNFVDTLQTVQEDLKKVSDDLSEITDDLIDITGGQDEFKGLIDIKNELEDGLGIEDFIEHCVILYSLTDTGCVISYTYSTDCVTCVAGYESPRGYTCEINYSFGSDESGYFECKDSHQGSEDENYRGNSLNCEVKYKSGDLDCDMSYSVSSTDEGFREDCLNGFSADSRDCELTYTYTSSGDNTRTLCMDGYNSNGIQCDNGYATIGYEYTCSNNYKDNSGNDCPSGYYYNMTKGKRCKGSYTTTINGTDITCNGYYSQAGATVCEGGFSSDDGVYCPVNYNETCTSGDGSNKCTSCDSACYTGNTATCTECVSSCNGDDSVCQKCVGTTYTPPCTQTCTPSNNQCATIFAQSCGSGYIAQCTVCVGGCHSGCDQGFSTLGCSSNNNVTTE